MRRPCFEPRCPALVERGVQYCPTHAALHAQRDAEHRGNERERGYTAPVRRAMQAYRRAHPCCEPCAREGRRRRTQIVDHRVPLRDGGNPLGPFEAQCRSCHAVKTAGEVRRRAALRAPVSFKGGVLDTAPELASFLSAPNRTAIGRGMNTFSERAE